MPFGPFKNWNACMEDMKTRGGYDEGVAEKVCGKLKAKFEKCYKDNQGMPTNWKLQTVQKRDVKFEEGTGDYPQWQNAQFYKGCKLCAIKEGQKVESEHAKTLESAGIPKEKISEAEKKIAQDHLAEDPKYYDKLKLVEGVSKADQRQTDTDKTDEVEIKNYRLNSKLSPGIGDLKEVREQLSKENVSKEWNIDLEELLKSEREFTGTFHKPIIDKENDIIPASAMDKAMDDFMVLPTLQEVHTERPIGIIVRAWKTNDKEYKFVGKVKPSADCDDVWKKIQNGEYDGLSIGGRRIKYSRECSIPSSIRTTPCVTQKLKLYNVSVCSSPVNPEATVDSVAKADDKLVFDITETLIKAESSESTVVPKGEDRMAEKQEQVVSKSDEDLITKSDIAGLTKAVEALNKSFAHYFDSLVTSQPQGIGGKGHSVDNTMQKDEDPDPDEDPKRRVRKDEDPDEDPGRRRVRKDEDPDEDPGRRKVRKDEDPDEDPGRRRVRKSAGEVEDLRKSFDDVITERDEFIKGLEGRLDKMEKEVIRKGGTAVIIPSELAADDPLILSNTALIAGAGRTAK